MHVESLIHTLHIMYKVDSGSGLVCRAMHLKYTTDFLITSSGFMEMGYKYFSCFFMKSAAVLEHELLQRRMRSSLGFCSTSQTWLQMKRIEDLGGGTNFLQSEDTKMRF